MQFRAFRLPRLWRGGSKPPLPLSSPLCAALAQTLSGPPGVSIRLVNQCIITRAPARYPVLSQSDPSPSNRDGSSPAASLGKRCSDTVLPSRMTM